MKTELSRRETAVLKGWAILGIMLHNYCHWLSFTIKENEYTFQYKWVYYLHEHVMRLDRNLLLDLLSFFGHYGVPVFVFLSGYGLVKKYGTDGGQMPSVWRFTRYNVLKFWRLMIPALLLFIAVDTCWVAGRFRYTWPALLEQLTFVINLFPDPGKHILPGPYWYFGLTLQLYLLYWLVMWRLGRTGLLLTAAASLAVQAVLLAVGGRWATDVLEYVRYNFVGALLPFCMGVYAARFGLSLPGGRAACAWGCLLMAVGVVWGGSGRYGWLLVPAFCVGVALLGLRALPLPVCRLLEGLGGLSASVFVLHPVWRPLWLAWGGSEWVYTGLLGYMVSVFLTAWVYQRFLQKLPVPRL